jgi:hypothetical protein
VAAVRLGRVCIFYLAEIGVGYACIRLRGKCICVFVSDYVVLCFTKKNSHKNGRDPSSGT